MSFITNKVITNEPNEEWGGPFRQKRDRTHHQLCYNFVFYCDFNLKSLRHFVSISSVSPIFFALYNHIHILCIVRFIM